MGWGSRVGGGSRKIITGKDYRLYNKDKADTLIRCMHTHTRTHAKSPLSDKRERGGQRFSTDYSARYLRIFFLIFVRAGGVGRKPDTLYKTFQHSHPILRAPDEPAADPQLENLVELDKPPQASAPSEIYPTLPLAPGDVVEATPGSSSISREQHLADETPLSFRSRDGQASDRALSRGLIPHQPPEVPLGDTDICRNDQQSKMERDKDSWSNGKGPDTSSPYTSKTEILTDGGSNGPKGAPGSRQFVYVLACFATIGGLLFGYDTGIVSGSMLSIKVVFKLNTVWQEAIVSGTIAAAAVFSLVSGVVCDLLGRRVTIMAASFIFAAGAIVMAVSPTKVVLLVGRIIVGAGIGECPGF